MYRMKAIDFYVKAFCELGFGDCTITDVTNEAAPMSSVDHIFKLEMDEPNLYWLCYIGHQAAVKKLCFMLIEQRGATWHLKDINFYDAIIRDREPSILREADTTIDNMTYNDFKIDMEMKIC